ncbi:hypothetical protein GCM10009641_74890 [Mycobacterium cookii]|uniref:MmyB-like transcription regulator ligand binding domain-containing protein n=1 Tax=Nocardioides furvisabuli TaxID=375542 RepID=A0ABP5IH12_9ACTN
MDGHWNIVRSNAAAEGLLAASDGRNAVQLTYAGAWRDPIDNWDDIAWAGLARVQAQAARVPQDEVLAERVDLTTWAMGDLPDPSAGASGPVLCPNFRSGTDLIRTVSVVAQFGSPLDVTLDELRIELTHPADDDARRFFGGG